MGNPTDEDKTKGRHQERPQIWLQLARSQHKNPKVNIQDNVSPPEASDPLIVDSEKCHRVEAKDKELKIAITSMFKALKEDMNKFLNDVR